MMELPEDSNASLLELAVKACGIPFSTDETESSSSDSDEVQIIGGKNVSKTKEDALLICGACKADFRVDYRKSRLLGCLHVVCVSCYQKGLSSDGKFAYECSICGHISTGTQATDNFLVPFLLKNDTPLTQPSQSISLQQQQHCTACPEGSENKAKSFCELCKDFLCTDCVAAHGRVKVTKSHVLKTLSHADVLMFPWLEQKELRCPWHKQEPLSVFCNSCQHLTCKDCQLSPLHKAHSYQLVKIASAECRRGLEESLSAQRKRIAQCGLCANTAKAQITSVGVRETDLRSDLAKVEAALSEAVTARCKELLQEIQSVSASKRRGYVDAKVAIDLAAASMEQVNFAAEAALASNNDSVIVYTNQLLVKRTFAQQDPTITSLFEPAEFCLDLSAFKPLVEAILSLGRIVDPAKVFPQSDTSSHSPAGTAAAASQGANSSAQSSSNFPVRNDVRFFTGESPPLSLRPYTLNSQLAYPQSRFVRETIHVTDASVSDVPPGAAMQLQVQNPQLPSYSTACATLDKHRLAQFERQLANEEVQRRSFMASEAHNARPFSAQAPSQGSISSERRGQRNSTAQPPLKRLAGESSTEIPFQATWPRALPPLIAKPRRRRGSSVPLSGQRRLTPPLLHGSPPKHQAPSGADSLLQLNTPGAQQQPPPSVQDIFPHLSNALFSLSTLTDERSRSLSVPSAQDELGSLADYSSSTTFPGNPGFSGDFSEASSSLQLPEFSDGSRSALASTSGDVLSVKDGNQLSATGSDSDTASAYSSTSTAPAFRF